MADRKDLQEPVMRILDKEPDNSIRDGEAIEDYMARIRFMQRTVQPLGDGTFLMLDDGDGVLQPDEARMGYNNPAVRKLMSDEEYTTVNAWIDSRELKGLPLVDIRTIAESMRQPATYTEDGKQVPLKAGDPVYEKIRHVDFDANGTITQGEYAYGKALSERVRAKDQPQHDAKPQQQEEPGQLKPPETPKPKQEEKKQRGRKEQHYILYA